MRAPARSAVALLAVALPWLVLPASPAAAHEARPAYLEISRADGRPVDVTWKVPVRGEAVLPIRPVFPEACRDAMPPLRVDVGGAEVVRRRLDCGPAGLVGESVRIEGLASTLTDVLVRVALGRGGSWSRMLKPHEPSFRVDGPPAWSEIAVSYLRLGALHIGLGVDHLLFVLGLMLLVRGTRLLVETITAFTVAHSLTLAAATLGLASLPPAPVEAVIALSIVFLASELVHQQDGRVGLAERRPWIVAFAFGLLHGFGFAGALREVGLPAADVPWALLFFNLGVEVGQLAFVAAVLVGAACLRRLAGPEPRWARRATAYGIGSISAYWLIERLGVVVAGG